jgi:hypothetical protein
VESKPIVVDGAPFLAELDTKRTAEPAPFGGFSNHRKIKIWFGKARCHGFPAMSMMSVVVTYACTGLEAV